jgi:hypothetical protein
MFPENFRQCQSLFSTPFVAIAPVTVHPDWSVGQTPLSVWDGRTIIPVTITNSDGRISTSSVTSTVRSLTTLSTGTLLAEPVTVYWQSSDLSLFPSAYASSLAALLNISLSVQELDPVLPPASGRDLGGGEITGIVVSAVLVALFLGGLIIFALRRRQRKIEMPDISEMHGQSSSLKRYLKGRWRAEVDGTSAPVEIDSKNVRIAAVELEGSHP